MDFMAFFTWLVRFLTSAYGPNSPLSLFTWLFTLAGLAIIPISLWWLPKMKEQYKELSAKIFKYAKPLSIAAIFVCFLIAAYSMQTQQASDLNNANKRITDLEFDRTIAEKQLKGGTQSTNSPTVSPLTIQANGAMTIGKVVNPAYNPSLPPNYRFMFQNIPGIGVSQELFSENSLLAVNFNFYVVAPIKIDLMQLSINGQTLESSPLIIDNFTPQLERLELLLWVFFKYESIIKPGNYDNVKLIAISDNTTFSSGPFTVTIPEPTKQEY